MQKTEKTNSDFEFLQNNSAKPPLKELIDAFKILKAENEEFSEKFDANFKIRFCDWPGQSPDGKKHKDKIGRPPFPFEGASDLCVYEIDNAISESVSILLNAVMRSSCMAIPESTQDAERAGLVSEFMRHMLSNGRIKEFRREMELFIQFALTGGASIMGIYWNQEYAREPVSISATQAAAQSEFIQLFLSENFEEIPEEIISKTSLLFGLESRKRAIGFLNSLKNKGSGVFYRKFLSENRPTLRAMRIGKEIFLPKNCSDLQKAPVIFTKEYMSISELKSNIYNGDWSEDFVDRVIARTLSHSSTNSQESSSLENTNFDFSEHDNVEIVTAFYKAIDSDGFVNIYYCIFSPLLGCDAFAKSDLLGLKPMRYPFVPLARQRVGRSILNSSGLPEVLEGHQREIKTQRDSRCDKTSLEVNPPKIVSPNFAPKTFGPNAMIPSPSPNVKDVIYEFKTSPISNLSLEIETSTRAELRSIACLRNERDDPNGDKIRKVLDDVFEALSEIAWNVFAYFTQYGDKSEYFLPQGASYLDGKIFDNIGGNYRFSFGWDVSDSDFEKLIKKYDVAVKFMPLLARPDTVNKEDILRSLFAQLFPAQTAKFVRTQDEGAEKEQLEVQSDISAIFSGQDVTPPENCNADLRLQFIINYVQSPDVQSRLAADPAFTERLQKYMKALQFQQQQRQNAQIGRLGVPPGTSIPANSQ